MSRHLLLADDSATTQRLIPLILADEDVRVTAVSTGREAIALCAVDPPDLILADVAMADGDGYDVLEHVRSTPALAHLPVLLMTSAFEPVDAARARAASCSGTITKPFESQRLVSQVTALLKPAGSMQPPAAPEVAPPDRAISYAPIAAPRTTRATRPELSIRRGPRHPPIPQSFRARRPEGFPPTGPREPDASDATVPAPEAEPPPSPVPVAPLPLPVPVAPPPSAAASFAMPQPVVAPPASPPAPASAPVREPAFQARPEPPGPRAEAADAHRQRVDLQLNPEPPPIGFAYPPAEESSPVWLWAAAAMLVVALGVAAFTFWRRTERTPASPDAGSTPTPATDARPSLGPPVAPLDVPPLDLTDPMVRELLSQLSSRPELVRWLATTGLIRNAVVVIDNVAEGRNPAKHLQVLAPSGPFRVLSDGELLRADPQTFQRYDSLADTVASLDADALARIYAALKPRLVEAYRELGHPEGELDAAVERALVHVLQVPVVPADALLDEGIIAYEYVEARFETLSGAQKQIARMGPRNQRLIQEKLRAFGLALGVSDARLPALRQARR